MNSVPMPVTVPAAAAEASSIGRCAGVAAGDHLAGKSEAGVQHQAVENGAAEGNRCAGAADRGGDRAGVDQRTAEVEGDAQHGTNDETRGGVDKRASVEPCPRRTMAAGGRDEAFVERTVPGPAMKHAIDNPGDQTVATVGQVAACVEEHADPAGACVCDGAVVDHGSLGFGHDAVAAGVGSGNCVGDGAAARYHHARAQCCRSRREWP